MAQVRHSLTRDKDAVESILNNMYDAVTNTKQAKKQHREKKIPRVKKST